MARRFLRRWVTKADINKLNRFTGKPIYDVVETPVVHDNICSEAIMADPAYSCEASGVDTQLLRASNQLTPNDNAGPAQAGRRRHDRRAFSEYGPKPRNLPVWLD